MRPSTVLVLAWALLGSANASLAQQPSVRLESRVTGNRELPKVTYILPWRQPGEVEFNWQPEAGIAADLFQPLRRDEYLRQLHHQKILAEGTSDALPSARDNQEERGK